jgi:hypothetical protein
MHKIYKRNQNLKNSCKGVQRVAALGRKKEWKVVSQLSTNKIQSKVKKVYERPKH